MSYAVRNDGRGWRAVSGPDDCRADEYYSQAAVDIGQSPEEQQRQFERAVQAHLDVSAKARGYDSIVTAVSYADEPAVATFQADGLAFRAWRSLVWDYCYAQLAAVKAGERAQPTEAEFIAELPALELPA